MPLTRVAFTVLMAMALAGCVSTDDCPGCAMELVHDDGMDVFARGVACWNAGDLEGYLATYAPDAVYVSGGEVLRGEAIAASYRERFGGGADMGHLRVEELSAHWTDGRRSFVTGRWILTRAGQPEARGVFSVGLVRVDGRWFISSDHSSGE